MDYSLLFDKIYIRNVELKNRIVFPPISTNFANPDGSLSERFIAHYERRAKGGAGLIIVENSCIDWPEGKKGAFQPRIDTEKMIAGWKELTERVHKYDAKISVELTHPGYEGKDINDLTDEEISFLISKYVEAALIAKNSGFDMVEIQGAHGLLVNKFLSPLTNKREDIWGKRLRFAIEIRMGIFERCGEDFPVTIRLAVDDFKEGGIDLREGKLIAEELVTKGYDMIQADVGLGPKELRLEPISYEEGWRSYLAKEILPQKVPVAAVGMIRSPETAVKILSEGADIVVLGRTLIADPDWPEKVRRNAIKSIRKCIGCSECIKARHDEDVPIRCGVNPNVGNEEELKPVTEPKKVVIVGCGPAGLEAATIAAKKGHNVVVFCKDFGGQIDMASVPPGKDKLKWLSDYFSDEIKGYKNIKIVQTEATKESVLNEKPDYLILASGVKPIVPFKTDGKRILSYQDILGKKLEIRDKRVVIGGGGLIGCETAELLSLNNRVMIIEMLDDVASGMETISRNHLLNGLAKNGVTIHKRKKILELNEREVIIENLDSGEKEKIGYDIFVSAFGNKPYIPFETDGFDCDIKVIGDALEVRKIVNAVKEGYEAAKAMD